MMEEIDRFQVPSAVQDAEMQSEMQPLVSRIYFLPCIDFILNYKLIIPQKIYTFMGPYIDRLSFGAVYGVGTRPVLWLYTFILHHLPCSIMFNCESLFSFPI